MKEEMAMRFNEGKDELSYMVDAQHAMRGMCRVLRSGAEKYERDNWKKGFEFEKLTDSLLRHLFAHQRGELLDPESGLPHVDHVLCNAMFISYHFNGLKETEDEG